MSKKTKESVEIDIEGYMIFTSARKGVKKVLTVTDFKHIADHATLRIKLFSFHVKTWRH